MKNKQLICRFISRILFTSLFLVFSTFFVFLPQRDNYAGALSYLIGLGDVKFIPQSKDLMLDKLYPIDDIEGMSTNPYIFELENTKNKSIKVQVTFNTSGGEEFVKNDTIKYFVEELSNDALELGRDGIIINDTLNSYEKKTYHLKFWLQEDKIDDILGKYFQGTIEVKVVS